MFILLATALVQDIKREDHPWARFNAGSWVELETKMSGGGFEMPAMSQKTTVKEVTDEFVVLAYEMSGTTTEQKLPLKGDATAKDEFVDKGAETLTVAGKTFACQIKEWAKDGTTVTSWTCADAPGGMVKSVTKSAGTEMTTQLDRFDEKVKVGDREVTCWVWKTTGPGSESELWRSKEVPGETVKMVTVSEAGGTKMTTTQTAVGFEVK